MVTFILYYISYNILTPIFVLKKSLDENMYLLQVKINFNICHFFQPR